MKTKPTDSGLGAISSNPIHVIRITEEDGRREHKLSK